MEIVSGGFVSSFNRSWRRRRYQRVNGGNRKTSKTVALGGGRNGNRRVWKIKAIPRLRWKKVSPIRLLIKLKNAYFNMMVKVAGSESVFGTKRVTRRLQGSGGLSMNVFESRLIYEISKNLVASRELAT